MSLWSKITLVFALFSFLSLSFLTPIAALAADDEYCDSKGHGADSADPWVNTGIGCLPVQADKLVAHLLPYIFGISGTVSFFIIIYGFILMATASGDPKALAGAQETITSAIVGLLVSIFAIFLLRLIAVGILKIPGLS